MKTLHRSLISLALALGCLTLTAPAAFAQSYTISFTTLNGRINNSQTTLVLTSASASANSSFGAPAANQCLFVDGELMRIVSMSSTTATVTRAVANKVGHADLATVWTAPCSAFKQTDPPTLQALGTVIPNSAAKRQQLDCTVQPRPWINVQSANVWFCNTNNNVWTGTNYMPLTYNSVATAQ